jgi:hypothetical protein
LDCRIHGHVGLPLDKQVRHQALSWLVAYWMLGVADFLKTVCLCIGRHKLAPLSIATIFRWTPTEVVRVFGISGIMRPAGDLPRIARMFAAPTLS